MHNKTDAQQNRCPTDANTNISGPDLLNIHISDIVDKKTNTNTKLNLRCLWCKQGPIDLRFGFEMTSAKFHTPLFRPKWRHQVRPILCCNWSESLPLPWYHTCYYLFDPLSPAFTLFQPLILLLPPIEERDDREEIALQVKRSSK